MGVRVDGQLVMNSTEVLALISAALQQIYPVGSLYFNTSNTNPSTILGFGTWAAYGVGQAIVGFDAGDVDFDTDEETGGEKTHALGTTEAPTAIANIAFDAGSGLLYMNRVAVAAYAQSIKVAIAGMAGGAGTNALGATIQHTVAGAAHNNQMKYITTRIWKRTA